MEIDNSFSARGKASKADERIAADLRRRVTLLSPGARLASVRELSTEYAASPVTVHRAMAQLAREGRVVTRPGDGTYVAERATESVRADSSWQLTVLGPPSDAATGAAFELPAPGVLSLGSGYPDVSLQPLSPARLGSLAARGQPGAQAVVRARRWRRR